jgi:hypothetical protein
MDYILERRTKDMKIVEKDNTGGDYYTERTIAENVNSYFGNLFVKYLNRNTDNSPDYYVLENDDYELKIYPFEP